MEERAEERPAAAPAQPRGNEAKEDGGGQARKGPRRRGRRGGRRGRSGQRPRERPERKDRSKAASRPRANEALLPPMTRTTAEQPHARRRRPLEHNRVRPSQARSSRNRQGKRPPTFRANRRRRAAGVGGSARMRTKCGARVRVPPRFASMRAQSPVTLSPYSTVNPSGGGIPAALPRISRRAKRTAEHPCRQRLKFQSGRKRGGSARFSSADLRPLRSHRPRPTRPASSAMLKPKR